MSRRPLRSLADSGKPLSATTLAERPVTPPPRLAHANSAPVCPYCELPIGRGEWSRDHIFPRVRGGKLGDGGRRIVHKTCNNLRNMAGECVGALFCASAVAETLISPKKRNARVRFVLNAWRLQEGARPLNQKRIMLIDAMRSVHLGLPIEAQSLSHLRHAVLDAIGRVRPRNSDAGR